MDQTNSAVPAEDELPAHLRPGFLDRCPVRPIGVYDEHFLVTDALGQPRVIRDGEFGVQELFALFAAEPEWLRRLWPSGTEPGDPMLDYNFSVRRCAESLMAACARIGRVDPRRWGFALELPAYERWWQASPAPRSKNSKRRRVVA